MKLADRVAGSRGLAGAAIFAAALALAGCGGGEAVRTDDPRWLTPSFSLTGAPLTDRADATGLPLPGGRESFFSLLYPVAVASRFGALFIADAGHRQLFRYERSSGLMHAVPGIKVSPGTILRVGYDGSLFALEPLSGEIARHVIGGQVLPPMQTGGAGRRYLDFAVSTTAGHLLAVDPMRRVVDQIDPFGWIAVPVMNIELGGPIAVDGDSVLIADAHCRCVNEWRHGNLVRRLAVGQIRLPKSLAAEKGEIYVLDGFDRSISRVSPEGLETVSARELNLFTPEQIMASGGMLYVADAGRHTVAIFRIRRHSSP